MRNGLLSIVIPVYNAARYVEFRIEQMMKIIVLHRLTTELIVIDDGSTDSTWEIVKQIASKHAHLTGIRFSRSFGQEAAICAGLKAGKGDCYVVIDINKSHALETIPELYGIWSKEKYDIVEAFPHPSQKKSLWQRGKHQLIRQSIKILSSIDIEQSSDFKLLDKQVVHAWMQFPERRTVFRELTKWLGFSKTHIYYTPEIPHKKSYDLNLKWRISNWQSMTSYTASPLQMVTFVGITFYLLALGFIILMFWQERTRHADSSLNMSVILLILLGSMVMMCIQLIAAYVIKIYDEVKARPRYIVRETIRNQISK